MAIADAPPTESDALSAGPERLVEGTLADRLRHLELFSRWKVEGMLHGPNRSPLIGFNSDFRQHRAYFPGDSLKHFDWRVYARTGRQVVRQYEETTNVRVHVVVDASGSMKYAGEGRSKWDFAVRNAAVLLYVAFLRRDAFSLSGFATARERHIGFGTGHGHLLRCFRSLLSAGAEGATDFDAGMGGALGGSLRHKGLTVVLSDCMDDPENIGKKIARVRSRGGDAVLFQVMDPSERSFDFNLITRFHDLEGPEILVVDPALMRSAYQRTFDDHVEGLRAACRRHGFDHHVLSVRDDYAEPLVAYLRWRMERFG